MNEGERYWVVDTSPALAEGTVSVEPASGAEKDTAAKPEALEPREHGKAGCRHKMPPQSEAGRKVEMSP